MKLLILLIFAAIISGGSVTKKTAVVEEDNKLSLQERKDGWQLLFDGVTLNSWHTYGYRSVVRAWEVADETIHLNPKDKGSWPNESSDLLTDDDFGDFDFKYDWKISKNGNSGLIFYVKEDKAKYKNTYETGPEMQVLDNNGHPDAKIIKHRAGDLYDLITSTPETVKPAG